MRIFTSMLLTALAVTPVGMSATVASAPAVAGQPYHRWAILSAGSLAKSALGDLLTTELSKVPGIELVERDRVDAALKELQLSQSLGDDVRGRLQSGRILKTDALVILSTVAGQPSASQPVATPAAAGPASARPVTFLKVVIADCRQGARLRTDFTPCDADQTGEAATFVLQTILQTRTRFAGGLQKVIGISHFVCRNFTHDYDQYQAGFAYLLENALASLPGTAVIEAEEARVIQRELALTATGDITRTVPFFLEGAYEVTPAGTAGPAKVQIEIRVIGCDGKAVLLQQPDLSLRKQLAG